jgi:hypothetical protein
MSTENRAGFEGRGCGGRNPHMVSVLASCFRSHAPPCLLGNADVYLKLPDT